MPSKPDKLANHAKVLISSSDAKRPSKAALLQNAKQLNDRFGSTIDLLYSMRNVSHKPPILLIKFYKTCGSYSDPLSL